MSFEATVYNVMISSTSDIITEKNITKEVINKFNQLYSTTGRIVLLPRSWETHSIPLQGERPQEIINKTVLADSDILVAIFWTRIGTPTGKSESGTIEEIEEHISSGKPSLIYFSSVPVVPGCVDMVQFSKLLEFKESIKSKGLYNEYNDYSDFKDLLFQHLTLLVQTHDYFRLSKNSIIQYSETYVDETTRIISDIPKEAKFILKGASTGSDGSIFALKMTSGLEIQFGEHGFMLENNRERAVYEAGIEFLVWNNLIKDVGYKNEIFNLTALGYKVADLLPEIDKAQ